MYNLKIFTGFSLETPKDANFLAYPPFKNFWGEKATKHVWVRKEDK